MATVGEDGGCLGTVAVVERESNRVLFESVARTPPGSDLPELGAAMAEIVVRDLHVAPAPTGAAGDNITAGGMAVRYLGEGRFAIGGTTVDLHRVTYAHDPAIDPDVPAATDVTLSGPANADRMGDDYAVITLYHVDPPLTGLPSREAGIDRGTDFRDPANLVKAAYTNYVSPVLTEDTVPVRVATHPIGHFFVKVEVPGYPIVLTGMTTIARGDRELVDLTLGRELGIGGVLLTPQPGRLNSAAEVARELALRQRRLRVVDGLYFRNSHGRNVGPEYVFDDGRLVFARFKLPIRNGTDGLAYFVEYIYRGGHNRFGSLLNRPFKGTGAGCSAFAMGWLQAAGIIPFITEPDPVPSPAGEAPGPETFWRAVHANVRIPWRHLGCDERVGAAAIHPAGYTTYDLLFHGETASFIRDASEGLAARIRASYGMVPATLFQFGVLTPLRDLVIDAKRKDPDDLGDYTWSGAGVDIPYWDNSRFAAWVRRQWEEGPRDPRITLVRERRFVGVEIDGMGVARQQELFFAAADRRNAALAAGVPPASSCQAVFERGLE
jgi:hypothetical protein